MASPTQWTWIRVGFGSWWWTGKPGVLQSMRLQRVGHDWATELNWTCNKGWHGGAAWQKEKVTRWPLISLWDSVIYESSVLDRISGKWLQPLFIFMLPFSHGPFGGCPETCCPNKAWQSQLYFPVKRILPAQFCLWVAHNGLCLTSFADFFKKLYLVLISHWLGTNPFEKGFLFLTRMKNVLSGKNTSQCLCFPFGLTWYFYPNGAASGNLWHTSVLCLFLFVPLGMDNYSFSKIHNTWHIFDESRAFVWKSG